MTYVSTFCSKLLLCSLNQVEDNLVYNGIFFGSCLKFVFYNFAAYRKELKEVKPSQACKVVGWRDLPHAGGEVLQVESEKRAHQVIHWRKEQEVKTRQVEEFRQIEVKREFDRKKYEELRMKRLEVGRVHLNYGRYDFYVRGKESQLDDGPPKVSIVVKADVDGSLEAIVGCLNTYKSSEVEIVRKSYFLVNPSTACFPSYRGS